MIHKLDRYIRGTPVGFGGLPKWFYFYAILLHIVLTIALFVIGQLELLPDMFDTQGLGTFASDSRSYMKEVESLVDVLNKDGVQEWLQSPTYFHVRVYSFIVAFLSPLFGFTILSIELLNLGCYLLVLLLVFALGVEFFNNAAGLLSAIAVSLWPSFLLHTTQILITPFMVIGVLLAILVNVRWFTRQYMSWAALLNSVLGFLAVSLLYLVRSKWWPLLITIFALGPLVSTFKMMVTRRWNVYSSISGLLMLAIGAATPVLIPSITSPLFSSSLPSTPSPTISSSSVSPTSSLVDDQDRMGEDFWATIYSEIEMFAAQIGEIRQGFVTSYPFAGSSIDTHYRIKDLSDLYRYFPRAVSIGFFAPFPNMWLVGGKAGLSARLFSGLETFLMYAVYCFAALCIWRNRRRWEVWYLLAVVIVGTLTLGLVIVNIGALFRFRYSFWMLTLLLGAGGFLEADRIWMQGRFMSYTQHLLGRKESDLKLVAETRNR